MVEFVELHRVPYCMIAINNAMRHSMGFYKFENTVVIEAVEYSVESNGVFS